MNYFALAKDLTAAYLEDAKLIHRVESWCEQCGEYKIIRAQGHWEAEEDGKEFIADCIYPGDEVCTMCGGKMELKERL